MNNSAKISTVCHYRITLTTENGSEVHLSHNPLGNFLLNSCTSETYLCATWIIKQGQHCKNQEERGLARRGSRAKGALRCATGKGGAIESLAASFSAQDARADGNSQMVISPVRKTAYNVPPVHVSRARDCRRRHVGAAFQASVD